MKNMPGQLPEGPPLELAKVQEVAPQGILARVVLQVGVEAAVVGKVKAVGAALLHGRHLHQIPSMRHMFCPGIHWLYTKRIFAAHQV